MKKIAIPLAAVIGAVGIIAFWLISSLDGIVKNQIEVIGSELTGVSVTVESVEINLGKGVGTITGLAIANPDGYNTDVALKLNLLSLYIDLDSLSGDPLILEKVVIDSLEGNLELREGGSNLSEIVKNIQDNGEEAEKKTEETDSGKPLILAIKKLLISNSKIIFTNKETVETKTIPTITLTDLGGKEGASPAQISGVIISKLVSAIVKEVAAQRLIKTVLDSVGEMTKGLLDSFDKAVE